MAKGEIALRARKWILLFVLPAMLLYAVFFIVPTLAGLGLSFFNWDGISSHMDFVGIKNYSNLVQDPIFRSAISNNIKFTLTVLMITIVLSLFLAVHVVKKTRFNAIMRVIFFLPLVLSSIAIAFIWTFLYDPNMGVINAVLHIFWPHWIPTWLGDPSIAIFALALVQIWTHTGQILIIFVAGLQTIPPDLYEAASIEGASPWQSFRYVTWPLLAPVAIIATVLTTIQSFKAFDLVFVMTDGGPFYSTEILATFIYHQAFGNYKFGYAAAASVVFMLLIALITLVQFKVVRRHGTDYA